MCEGYDFNMNRSLPRALALIVLIAVCLVFTGLSSYATVTPPEKTAKSCCDECNKEAGKTSDSCSTPDCPMFLCLSMNIITSFTPAVQTESVFVAQHAKELHLSISTKPIFHPPAVA